MEKYYLAIDIGASSGRHILGHIENGKIVIEEIYRFSNGMIRKNGHLCWNVEKILNEILQGLKECKKQGKIPYSLAVDTWAVDFVLLNNKKEIIGDAVAYRDSRTKGIAQYLYQIIEEKELYQRTGIQKQLFNTIYQLSAIQKDKPKQLEEAEAMLMIPDYLNYCLTGKEGTEYTNATTTQLVSPITKDWDDELIQQCGFPRKIFQEIKRPGEKIGELAECVQKEVGFNCMVVLPATHDTGSAVISVPSNEEHTLYISSGTWSLMGTELKEANCSLESMIHNFTNEGGYDNRFRYLKNIMGLWMIQSVKQEIAPDLSYAELCNMASCAEISSLVDCNEERFLAPHNMTTEIQNACRENGCQVPHTVGEVAKVIYDSLAHCYAKTAKEIELMTGVEYQNIYIVGGGANAEYLNKLTAQVTGKCVLSGPTEATAIGNLIAQMISDHVFLNLTEARICIMNSFAIKKYIP